MLRVNTYRAGSVDLLRGIVMIIMALDHTRDFFHESAMTADPLDPATGGPTLYFTRWITHFCAPVFVFLSGISAFLAAGRKSKAEASNFLIKRGLWLVIVEMTIVTFGLTFNPDFNTIIWQVIWAIGCSMIILGLLARTNYNVILIVGLILFFGHNITNFFNIAPNTFTGGLTSVLLTARGFFLPLDNTHFIGVFYAILPWTGIMLLGYCAGRFFQSEYSPEKRRKLLLFGGIGMIALFIILRITGIYGNPEAWDGKSLYSFLNTSKYPPSLQYACMTLGPALIFMALFDRSKAGWTKIFSVYGRVPFFYYILHFYLLHLLLVILFYATGHTRSEIADPNSPFFFRPVDFGFGLPVVYVIWIGVVCALYLPSLWFARYKSTHRQWWLKYI
jgi:uncharacterized membrane protein